MSLCTQSGVRPEAKRQIFRLFTIYGGRLIQRAQPLNMLTGILPVLQLLLAIGLGVADEKPRMTRGIIFKKSGFTLLELIVVIIIIGILATVGLSRYTTIIERGRASEGKANLAEMRKLVYEYYLKNSTVATVTNSDVGVGNNGIPSSCTSSYYFYYSVTDPPGQSSIQLKATRCTSGGKPPQGSSNGNGTLAINLELTTGSIDGYTWTDGAWVHW